MSRRTQRWLFNKEIFRRSEKQMSMFAFSIKIPDRWGYWFNRQGTVHMFYVGLTYNIIRSTSNWSNVSRND